MLCYRTITGTIILYDHVNPKGAFHKRTPLQVRNRNRRVCVHAHAPGMSSLTFADTWRRGGAEGAPRQGEDGLARERPALQHCTSQRRGHAGSNQTVAGMSRHSDISSLCWRLVARSARHMHVCLIPLFCCIHF